MNDMGKLTAAIVREQIKMMDLSAWIASHQELYESASISRQILRGRRSGIQVLDRTHNRNARTKV